MPEMAWPEMVGDGWVTARLSRGSVMTQPLGQPSPVSLAVAGECWWVFLVPAENGSPLHVISLSSLYPCFFSIWLLSSVLVSFS
jgi:hypothetical protein